MKELIDLIGTTILLLPCLCAFSEGDNVCVNVFGVAYTIVLCIVVKYAHRHIRNYKSTKNR